MCAIPASEEFSTDLSYSLFTYVTLFGESILISTNSLKFFDIHIIFTEFCDLLITNLVTQTKLFIHHKNITFYQNNLRGTGLL